MEPFFKKTGLPSHLKRWQNTVDAMLDGVDADGPIYLMIDQKHCLPGQMHRREGIHIDGYWHGHGIQAHSHSSEPSREQWSPEPAKHQPMPFEQPEPDETPSPRRIRRRLSAWSEATLSSPEAIILASNYESCRGYLGNWEGSIGNKGACEHIDVADMNPIMLKSDTAYVGNVAFLHETLPVQHEVMRTLVRLNVSGWEPDWTNHERASA